MRAAQQRRRVPRKWKKTTKPLKRLALCGRGEGAAAFLVRVGAGPLLRVHVGALGRGGSSAVLVQVGALVAQPLVAQRAQALSQRRLGTLGAALEAGGETQLEAR